MTRLPLRTVQPLKSWAAVTESTSFRPMQTLGQSPAQGEQVSLGGQPDELCQENMRGLKVFFQLKKMSLKFGGHACEKADVRKRARVPPHGLSINTAVDTFQFA